MGVTVLAAAATAHLMQRSSGDAPRMASATPAGASVLAAAAPVPAGNPVIIRAKPVVAVPDQPDAMLQPAVAMDDTPALAQPVAETAPVEISQEVPVVAAVEAADRIPDARATTYPDMPSIPTEALMPKPLPDHGPDLRSRMATVAAEPADPVETPAPEIKRSEFGLSCGALLTASPKDAAMVGLTLTDPCRGAEVFTLQHGDLAFTARLNALGTYMIDVPALRSDAQFTVRFQDGSTVEAEVAMPTTDQVDRVALFTTGQPGLAIHALEFGADYGEAGHVWADNPRDPDTATRTGGGFITQLGDASLPDAQLAEVYTFPADAKHRDGVVRLSIETEVTATNCGKDIAGRSLQKVAGEGAAPVSLTLAMPDCDAIGEFLVLKNLLRDLKIASN